MFFLVAVVVAAVVSTSGSWWSFGAGVVVGVWGLIKWAIWDGRRTGGALR
jgi:hypothetical protein